MAQKLKFPENFLWGASTAAHQVEGNNFNSDWWAWEHSEGRANQLRAAGKDPVDFYSGIACDSYNRFDEDFSLAQHLNHNATRFSIEWARIEPREGEFNEDALDHYEKVLRSAKSHGLQTFVTLHHFSSPLWFSKKGGFAEKKHSKLFERYALTVVKRLSEYVDFWLTFNEPEVYVSQGYLRGIWPPLRKGIVGEIITTNNIIRIHNALAPQIRQISRKPVSMAYKLMDIEPSDTITTLLNKFIYQKINNYILDRTKDQIDFIGINYYIHHHIRIFGRGYSHSHHQLSDMGWGIHPEGLERVLLRLKQHNKPIYITENGLADAQDSRREKFIKDHLYYIHRAIQQGVNVKGYLHWSLIDNFEWDHGFEPRFGLIEIDRNSLLERKVRYSALKYAEICKNNFMEY